MPNQPPYLHRQDINHNMPFLDGVRGLAILLVASGHFFTTIYIFKISWIGLNLFFVLSGYLITRSLFQLSQQSTAGYFRNFYGRRILRIFPLYYGVLIFFFLLLPLISQRIHFYYEGLDSIQSCYWLYVSNWNMITNGMPHQPIFFHFWSLAVEEQFYLLWPVLFLLFKSSKRKYILISVLLALSVFNRISTDVALHAYLSSFTAAEPLLLGCLVSILQQDGILHKISKQLTWLSGVSVVFLCIVFLKDSDLHITNVWLMKYGYSAINIIIVSLMAALLTGVQGRIQLRSFFSMQWLRWLGKYSYSIYVFHWIILQTIVFKLEGILLANSWNESLAYLLSRIAGIALTLFVSYYSYNYFEARFLSLKTFFTDDKPCKWKFIWSAIFYGQAKPLQS